MSEKHLIEKPWKELAAKQGIKDLGLQKSFAAYANVDAAKEPVKAVEVLKEISELAIRVKKTSAAKADIVDYLDEVLKEVKKILPGLEAKAKAGAAAEAKAASEAKAEATEEEEEESEEAETEKFKKDLKQQMISALAQVKVRAPGEETDPKPQLQFMAYLAGKVSSVIVAKKVGTATKKLLLEIAGGVSGGKFAIGECIFEKNAHTFVCDPVPSGLAKKLSVALQAETTAKYKVRARSADGSTVLDSDTDVDPDAVSAAATAPKPPVSPPPPPEASKGATPKPPPAPPQSTGQTETTAKEVKLSTYLSGRKNLRTAREQAEKELKRLQEAILAKAADEPFYKEVETKSQKLMGYLTPIDDSVANKLDDAGRCTDREEQATKNQEVRKLIQKQLNSLHSHPLAVFIEKNPFGKFIIKQPLEVTLTALDKQLS